MMILAYLGRCAALLIGLSGCVEGDYGQRYVLFCRDRRPDTIVVTSRWQAGKYARDMVAELQRVCHLEEVP